MCPPFKQSRCAGTEIHVHASAKRRRPTMDMPAVAIARCDAKLSKADAYTTPIRPRMMARTMMPTRMMLTFMFFLRMSHSTNKVRQSGTKPMKI